MDVLIIYHYYAHYRKAIFKELLNSTSMNVVLAGDTSSNNDIKLVDESSNIYYENNFIFLINLWIKGKYLWQIGALSALFKRKWKAIILLGDPNFISTWVILIISKVLPFKSYLWTHGFVMRGGRWQRIIKKFMYYLADGIFLYGDISKNELIKEGVDSKKLHVIYNSLDFAEQSALRNKISTANTSFVKERLGSVAKFQLVFIGRLTFHKKLDQVILAMVTLIERGYPVVLVFIGDGEARVELEELANKFGISSAVKFLGKIHDENEIAPILMSSDVCVSPGEIGLTAMHVMGYGVPVVTHSNDRSQMPEFEAVRPSYSGELFEQDNIDSLVEAIIRVYDRGSVHYRGQCIKIMESNYNAIAQARIIEQVLNS